MIRSSTGTIVRYLGTVFLVKYVVQFLPASQHTLPLLRYYERPVPYVPYYVPSLKRIPYRPSNTAPGTVL